MEPNPPLGRFRHVVKTYRGSKSPHVALDTIWIGLTMMGKDHEASWFRRVQEPLSQILSPYGLDPDLLNMPLDRDGDQYINFPTPGDEPPEKLYVEEPHHRERVWELTDNLLQDWGLDRPHEYDFVIPWVARELGRLSKAVLKKQADPGDYYVAAAQLAPKAPAIAMWATRENIDLGNTTLRDALEAIKHFDAWEGQMPQGRVVMEFPDGYSIQELTEQKQFEAEGESMQHCVGSYDASQCGPSNRTRIFSLRDERGMPHVTMEWEASSGIDSDEAYASSPKKGHFRQIYGKQNALPAQKYVPYIEDFISFHFDDDPLGLLLLDPDLHPSEVSFNNAWLSDDDFIVVFEQPGREVDNLDGVDFSNAVMVGLHMSGMSFIDADFNSADMRYCDMEAAFLQRASFDGANLDRCNLQTVDGEEASFVGTTLVRCDLSYANFTGADFSGADMPDTELVQTDFDEAKLVDVKRMQLDSLVDPIETAENAASVWNSPLASYLEPQDDEVDPDEEEDVAE